MARVDQKKTRELLQLVCQKIGGDWLLLGGSLVTLLFNDERATHDVDLVPLEKNPNPALKASLYTEAKQLGFVPESLNSAADFFLRQIPEWEQHISVLESGPKGKIYQPDLTLFMLLKLGRGSEIDIQDIRHAIKTLAWESFDEPFFKKAASPEVANRFQQHFKGNK